MDLYSQNILDHYRNPRNKGVLESPDVQHSEANYSCGDKVELFLKIQGNVLEDIKFLGAGCSISQAAISIITEFIKGKTLEEILELGAKDIISLLGIPVSRRRLRCALLSLLSIKNAILKYQNKPLLKWADLDKEELK